MTLALLLCAGLLFVAPVHAQDTTENCRAQPLTLASASDSTTADTTTARPSGPRPEVTNPRPATLVTPRTDAASYVQDVISQDGIHVVHFWAPWCENSRVELKAGWPALVRHNPEVTFTFVTIWNDGESGTSLLEAYDLPDRVTEVTQPDLGPSNIEANRRQTFLSHPVTWIPSTWIFHNNGELAFALNYGEMDRSTLQQLIDVTRKDW